MKYYALTVVFCREYPNIYDNLTRSFKSVSEWEKYYQTINDHSPNFLVHWSKLFDLNGNEAGAFLSKRLVGEFGVVL